MNSKYLSRELFFMVIMCIYILGFCNMKTYANENTNPDFYEVKNIKELNEALGGNHIIKGNTLFLNSDVDTSASIWFRGYSSSKLIINLNGHTIKYTASDPITKVPFMYFGYTSENLLNGSEFYFKGKGKIISNAVIFCTEVVGKAGHYNISLHMDGDIIYKSVNTPVINNAWKLTINNGLFISEQSERGTMYLINPGTEFVTDINKESYVIINGGRIRGYCFFANYKLKIRDGVINGEVRTASLYNYISGGKFIKSLIVSEGWPIHMTIDKKANLTNGMIIDASKPYILIKGGTITGKKVAINLKNYYDEDWINSKDSYLKIKGGIIQTKTKNGVAIKCDKKNIGYINIKINGGKIKASKRISYY